MIIDSTGYISVQESQLIAVLQIKIILNCLVQCQLKVLGVNS